MLSREDLCVKTQVAGWDGKKKKRKTMLGGLNEVQAGLVNVTANVLKIIPISCLFPL